MSRHSRRIRRALVLLNLMVGGYNVAVAWSLWLLVEPAWAYAPAPVQDRRWMTDLMLAFPQAALATGLALALVRWSPPRAPVRALRAGAGIQAATSIAALAGAATWVQVALATAYAAVALWLATRTFLAGEPVSGRFQLTR